MRMPQLRVHPERRFTGLRGPSITGSGGALMYTDGLGVQKNRGPIKLLELSWANGPVAVVIAATYKLLEPELFLA